MERMDATESDPLSIPAIGIDLGTTNCCVGVYHNGKVQIIRNCDDGGPTTPSYVNIGHDGETVTVGKHAKDNAFKDPQNTIYDVKRILGRTFSDPKLQEDLKYWPFIVEEHDGVPKVNVNGRRFYPEEISARLLKTLKASAEKQLKLQPGSITKAVITVPAYFNDGQRQATIDAGELAGFKELQLLNEPTAAAIAYFVGREAKDRKVLVYDLGGGTFDVAVLEMKSENISVLGVHGDTHLGGEDFDKTLMKHCVSTFSKTGGIDLLQRKDSRDTRARQKARRNLRRLQTYCENTKQYLTASPNGSICMDALYNGKDLDVRMSREDFEKLNEDHFKKTITLVDETLRDLQLTKEDIDDVVLVGGSTRIPKIQQLLKDYFGGKMLDETMDPDQSVAYGAAYQAAKMNGNNLIGQIVEVTPMPIGVEVNGKELSVVIPKNIKIPAKKDQTYRTKTDDQTDANIMIYQGEDLKVAAHNKLLGNFLLRGIPPNKAGKESLKVTMEITAMGILHVTAVCLSNQVSNKIAVVEKKSRMDEDIKARLREKLMKK